MAIQFPNIFSALLDSLTHWSWTEPFHVSLFVLFMVGLVPEVILLKLKWRPWAIPLILGCLILCCEIFLFFEATQLLLQVIGTVEMLFLSALFGALGAKAGQLFWRFVKKKKPDYLKEMEQADEKHKEEA